MGIAVIADPQSKANLLRALLTRDPSVRESGAQVRFVAGTPERLLLEVRHGERDLVFERGPGWTRLPLGRTKALLKAELLGELGVRASA